MFFVPPHKRRITWHRLHSTVARLRLGPGQGTCSYFLSLLPKEVFTFILGKFTSFCWFFSLCRGNKDCTYSETFKIFFFTYKHVFQWFVAAWNNRMIQVILLELLKYKLKWRNTEIDAESVEKKPLHIGSQWFFKVEVWLAVSRWKI